MTTGGSMRASDDDRERVVSILREQTVKGRLTLEEFNERMDAAYAAKTWDELRKLTVDLPVQVVFADEGGRASHPLPVDRPYGPGRGGGFPARRLLWLVPVLAWSSFWVLASVGAHVSFVLPLLVLALVCFGGCRRRGLTYPAEGRGQWSGHHPGPRTRPPRDERPPGTWRD